MARLTKTRSLEPVINAAQKWIHDCLIADNSVFSSGLLWTPESVEEVRSAFIDHPNAVEDEFSAKLKGQMASASSSAKKLMAEMVWALLLFPSNIKVSTKRQQVGDMWPMSGDVLAEGELLLSDDVLAGIGSGGSGFNSHRWREMVFLISLVGDLKKRPAGERQKLMSVYEAFVDWIAQVPQDGHRQFRHMLRFFCFPDRVERMSSNRERWAVLEGYGVSSEKNAKKLSDSQLDEALFTLRTKLEAEHPGEMLDFYEAPLRERWKPTEEEETENGANRRFWVEKTIVKNRPDRQTGENALGKALWSPQRAEDGKDIYRQMREVRSGDVVFHFVDNVSLASFSIAESEANESFVGVAGTAWAGRPAYRIPLSHHQELAPPIDRKEFLQEDRYRSAIADLLAGSKGLFFNKEYNLNQGSYLTEAPLKLIQIWNDIQMRKTQLPICKDWNIQPLEAVDRPGPSQPAVLFDSSALVELLNAIEATRFRIQKEFLKRFTGSLLTKQFLILTGNSGTGKTRSAEDLAAMFRDADDPKQAKNVALVAVGADWTDNRNVVGYVNHLREIEVGGHKRPVYQTTPVLDLLLEASRPGREALPHFLILDEMNLSHVERYFADFLSAMEARDGAIRLHSEGEFRLPRFEGDTLGVPQLLPYPANLFVIGTVNVDETTYMFSPKVLDRAHVIEFQVDPEDVGRFLDDPKPLQPVPRAATGQAEAFLELSLRARGVKEPPQPELKKEVKTEVNRHLLEVLEILQSGRFEFAFRTAKEVVAYLKVSCELAADKAAWEAGKWKSDLDDEILQKILPKLSGSKRRIEGLLVRLARYCETGVVHKIEDSTPADYQSSPVKRADAVKCKFSRSHGKLCDMIDAVRRDQFVSFIH